MTALKIYYLNIAVILNQVGFDNLISLTLASLQSLGVDALHRLFNKMLASTLAWLVFIPKSNSSEISSKTLVRDTLHTSSSKFGKFLFYDFYQRTPAQSSNKHKSLILRG